MLIGAAFYSVSRRCLLFRLLGLTQVDLTPRCLAENNVCVAATKNELQTMDCDSLVHQKQCEGSSTSTPIRANYKLIVVSNATCIVDTIVDVKRCLPTSKAGKISPASFGRVAMARRSRRTDIKVGYGGHGCGRNPDVMWYGAR